MSRRTGWALFLLLAAVFFWVNRLSYQGYFSDDEINSMAWTRWKPSIVYLQGALTPVYTHYFRAVGFLYFHLAEELFGPNFAAYVFVIQAIHLINVWMLWLFIRGLGASALGAGLGAAFYALHMTLFNVVWKPMFVFDLLCGAFCMASLLLWSRGHWILSFIAFWLAFQSKELAVMLPIVLACHELWFGGRRWLQLIPFAAVSASFAVQALWFTAAPSGEYTFHFTLSSLAATVPFYAKSLLLTRNVVVLLLVAALAMRSRRASFGVAMLLLFFIPLLFLPGRILTAYCYLPFLGLAVVVAGLAEMARPEMIAICLLLWIPREASSLRVQQQATLREARDIRAWMTSVREFANTRPPGTEFTYDGAPCGLHAFGVEAAVKYFLHSLDATTVPVNSPEGERLSEAHKAPILRWDEKDHQLRIETP